MNQHATTRGETATMTDVVFTPPAGFKGRVITARNEPYNYELARTIFNKIHDGRPAAIVQVLDIEDAALVAGYAGTHGIPLAVRGGGHGQDAYAMPDGALVLDFSLMRRIEVDPRTRVITAEAGCRLGDLDAAAAAHGLAAVAGTVSGTGIAGLTLGGGIGWLMRQFGTTVDNVLAINAVTLDGRVVRATATENPDLFWAMRGGGGNFAIATSFEYRGHPVARITGGSLVHGPEDAVAYLRHWRDVMLDAPRELASFVIYGRLPPFPYVPAEVVGAPGVITMLCHSGDEQTAARDIRSLLGFGSPLGTNIARRSYLDIQHELDFADPGGRVHQLGGYLREFSDETIAALTEDVVDFPVPRAPGDAAATVVTRLGGAIDDFDEDSTAFSRREGTFAWESMPVWSDPASDAEMIGWTESVRAALAPWTADACYINFSTYQGAEWLENVYGAEKFARLREIKKVWDPQNLLRFNKNIPPAVD